MAGPGVQANQRAPRGRGAPGIGRVLPEGGGSKRSRRFPREFAVDLGRWGPPARANATSCGEMPGGGAQPGNQLVPRQPRHDVVGRGRGQFFRTQNSEHHKIGQG
jgi:hypothetical protein